MQIPPYLLALSPFYWVYYPFSSFEIKHSTKYYMCALTIFKTMLMHFSDSK